MAARYPVPCAAFRHASQSNANANSLAGASSCRYRPLVPRAQSVPNIVIARLLWPSWFVFDLDFDN